MSSIRSILFVPVALVACGGGSLDVGANAVSFAHADPAPIAPDGAILDAGFTADQVEAAMAICTQPHGPTFVPTSAQDVLDRLAGAWLLCDPDATRLSAVNPGVGFAADGTWVALASDGHGGLEAMPGVATQGDFILQCDNAPEPTPALSAPCPPPPPPETARWVWMQMFPQTQDPFSAPMDGIVGLESSPPRLHIPMSPALDCTQLDAGPCDLWFAPL